MEGSAKKPERTYINLDKGTPAQVRARARAGYDREVREEKELEQHRYNQEMKLAQAATLRAEAENRSPEGAEHWRQIADDLEKSAYDDEAPTLRLGEPIKYTKEGANPEHAHLLSLFKGYEDNK